MSKESLTKLIQQENLALTLPCALRHKYCEKDQVNLLAHTDINTHIYPYINIKVSEQENECAVVLNANSVKKMIEYLTRILPILKELELEKLIAGDKK